jgi:hypothetical protein
MRASNVIRAAAICALAIPLCTAQVLSPPEIVDPELRALQEKHMTDLKGVAVNVSSQKFPYHFYFSRKLDVSEEQERILDQRSIQFARFRNQIVLQITGNYFASYSAELMDREARVHQTMTDLMFPILKAAVAGLQQETGFQSYALEISHHVRKKVLGVSTEHVENVVLVVPREAGPRFLAAGDAGAQEAALMAQATVLVDGQPSPLWPGSDIVASAGPVAKAAAALPLAAKMPSAPVALPAPTADAPKPAPALTGSVKDTPSAPVSAPAVTRDSSPEAIRDIQLAYQDTLNKMVRELDGVAHFVAYAPPAFIGFHKGVYLQLTTTTPLPADAAGSQYRLAARAFDEHVAHLIRPLTANFREDPPFDGIDFSTSIRLAGAAPDAASAPAVEYILTFPALRCYEAYDCTGQQLLNAGYVLINGERVSLDLQNAEVGIPK